MMANYERLTVSVAPHPAGKLMHAQDYAAGPWCPGVSKPLESETRLLLLELTTGAYPAPGRYFNGQFRNAKGSIIRNVSRWAEILPSPPAVEYPVATPAPGLLSGLVGVLMAYFTVGEIMDAMDGHAGVPGEGAPE